MLKNKRLNIRLDEELDNMITVLCWEKGINKSELISSLISDKFQELENRIGKDLVLNLISELCAV